MSADLKKFIEVQEKMKSLPQVDIEIRHHFAKGIYCREMRAPANSIVMGKIHKTEHLNILSMGSVAVSTPEGETNIYEAPCMIHSEPGTKRILLGLTDYVWTNIHHNPTDCRNEEMIEDIFIDDYSSFLLEKGIDQARIEERIFDDTDVDFTKIEGVALKDSPIHGKGVFAEKDFKIGDTVGPALIGEKRTIIGRYTNHSPNPNVRKMGDCFESIREIKSGDEITVNYRENFKEALA